MALPRHNHLLPPAPTNEGTGEWPALDTELLTTLPSVLRAIVRALGFVRARDWLSEHGGVNCNIPAYRETAIGLNAEELARIRVCLQPHLDAQGRVWLPKADKLFLRLRNSQIRKDRDAASLSQLARSYRLSSRQIQNICANEDDAQFDLF